MVLTLVLPDQYGYVLSVASASFFIGVLHSTLTGTARKRSGLKYPISYATEEQAAKDKNAYTFNCGQ
jgi:glutathione S-transferase